MLRVRIGSVRKPHGIRGFLKVAYTTDHPELISTRPEYLLVDPRSYECVRVEVDKVELKLDHFLISFKGYSAPEPLKAFNGWDMVYFARRGELPRDDPDEVYYFELEGMEARTASGEVLGSVRSVVETGAGILLELDDRHGTLIPFNRQNVPELNLADAWLVVVPPE